MQFYLLIGAGFSRNWGGWVASEALEFLLGDPSIIGRSELRETLWKYKDSGGFEAALDELLRQGSPETDVLYRELRDAVIRMFDNMNAGFNWKGLEFREPFGNDHPIRNLLIRFKAIFSLNQDLLLETLYRGTAEGLIDRDNPRTERSWHLPGMRAAPANERGVYVSSALRRWTPTQEHVVAPESQPIFKLHGSTNWRTAEDSEMMILGGGKQSAIERFPVLKWYSEKFLELISQPNARLMIVGYSFRDAHINAALIEAIERGLKIFIIDTLGADAPSAANPLQEGAIGYSLTPIEISIRRALIGASRRRLSETFGSDGVEFQKIARFFN